MVQVAIVAVGVTVSEMRVIIWVRVGVVDEGSSGGVYSS